MEKLIEQIKVVAQKRNDLSELNEARKQKYAEWETQNKVLIENIQRKQEELSESENLLREFTINVYKETGNKKPAEGVGIREVTKLEYDPQNAFNWALDHKIALSLDKKSFEGFAKSTPLDFVTINIETQATIATDLNKAINA